MNAQRAVHWLLAFKDEPSKMSRHSRIWAGIFKDMVGIFKDMDGIQGYGPAYSRIWSAYSRIWTVLLCRHKMSGYYLGNT